MLRNIRWAIVHREPWRGSIAALKQIREEGTDEHLVAFFFQTAIRRMTNEMAQKHRNSLPLVFF